MTQTPSSLQTPLLESIAQGDATFLLEIWPGADTRWILFYAGTMLSPLQYRTFILALQQEGFSVAAPHFSGHGLAQRPSGVNIHTLLAEALAAERWLCEQGYRSIAVSGHSQGGILALAHAASSTELSACIPVSAILPQIPLAIQATRFASLGIARSRLIEKFNALARFAPQFPIPLPCYLSLAKIHKGHGEIHTSRRKARFSYPLSFLASLFNLSLPEQLFCPLCLFSARNDALFSEELTRETFAHIKTPCKELHWLEGGGHLAVFDPSQAQFIAKEIARFWAAKSRNAQS